MYLFMYFICVFVHIYILFFDKGDNLMARKQQQRNRSVSVWENVNSYNPFICGCLNKYGLRVWAPYFLSVNMNLWVIVIDHKKLSINKGWPYMNVNQCMTKWGRTVLDFVLIWEALLFFISCSFKIHCDVVRCCFEGNLKSVFTQTNKISI